jgi:exopolysaccharide biosynthesis WecB/TagA/CpsF family protein
LNLLHGAGLRDRVYGPELTLRLLAAAEQNDLPVYFYGTTPDVLARLKARLAVRHPRLKIAGMEPSRFRKLTIQECSNLVGRIEASGAKLLFAALGCPRQEVFAFELRPSLSMPIVAVGAAFPFIAGTLPQAPPWMQRRGLEWFFRLVKEPKRLWRRYLFTNTLFVLRIVRQFFGKHFSTDGDQPDSTILFG